ncbi:MAG: SirB2 family protein [Gammaproteobacteria bacterium]|nr:SirB2 family protein [Gammaproteobacteria bacterium]
MLGTVAIRRGSTLRIRIIAFVGALSVFAYIVGVALSKSPASWLAYLS